MIQSVTFHFTAYVSEFRWQIRHLNDGTSWQSFFCPLASTFFGVDARVRRMFLPPPSNPNAKLGFSTYAMWALCVVVVGVCYKLEQNELSARPAGLVGIPDTVQKVMPSGAWLMSARRALCSYRCYSAHSPHCVVGRGRLHPEGQLNPPSSYAAVAVHASLFRLQARDQHTGTT